MRQAPVSMMVQPVSFLMRFCSLKMVYPRMMLRMEESWKRLSAQLTLIILKRQLVVSCIIPIEHARRVIRRLSSGVIFLIFSLQLAMKASENRHENDAHRKSAVRLLERIIIFLIKIASIAVKKTAIILY